MTARRVPMLDILRMPESAAGLTPSEWTQLLGSARHSRLLPRISLLLEGTEAMAAIPSRVRDQLLGARPIAQEHERSIRWEVGRIREALRGLATKLVLLKGAAYVMAGLPAGRGRLATDVDILVPQRDIRAVEQALLTAGWAAVKLHPYDQRFYRQWSHELPPLQHQRRRSVVDVHHNILPVSGRLHPDAELLLASAVPVPSSAVEPVLWMLGPEDMVLHCAVHLFQDGDLGGSVRDLVDADALLTHFGETVPGFWERLPARAHALGLERPLFYVLRFARRMLGTRVPEEVDANLPRPPAPVVALMDRLVSRSLLPMTGQHGTFGEETARALLYARSHWLRMPPGRLALHLMRKSLRRWADDEDE